jgi:hypothetical protein
MTERTMSSTDMARTSNEWMRRYIEEPDKFEREFQSVGEFLAETSAGKEPTYGERCSAYQFHLLDEMNAADAAG